MPLVVGGLAFSFFFIVIVLSYVYVNYHTDREGGRSTVHAAENKVPKGSKENAKTDSQGKAKEEEKNGKRNGEKNVDSTGDNRYDPKQKMQSFGPSVPQSLSEATGGALFRSCQARVNLWNFMVLDNSSVERGKRLGQGAYAEVYEGKVRDFKCAIKLYRITASQKQLKEAKREIMLMASLEHPCTLRLIGWVKRPLQTITELCLGDLKDFYKSTIEGLHYSEFRALMLLRVSLSSRFVKLGGKTSLLLYDAAFQANLHCTYLTGERCRAPIPPHRRHHSP